jgi:hypothetical protein
VSSGGLMRRAAVTHSPLKRSRKVGERLAVARGRRRVAVTVPGQAPDVVAEHVGGDVLDIPAWAGRGPRPLGGAEPVQEIDERGLLPGEQRPDVDGRSQPGDIGHQHRGVGTWPSGRSAPDPSATLNPNVLPR